MKDQYLRTVTAVVAESRIRETLQGRETKGAWIQENGHVVEGAASINITPKELQDAVSRGSVRAVNALNVLRRNNRLK